MGSTEFTGIILAGGRSSRMGRDKGLVVYGGKTLLRRAIDVLSGFCSDILVISANPEYQQAGITVIPDLIAGKGPMMGLYTGLTASETRLNLVMAVDNCFVGPEFYEYLLPQIHAYQAAVPYLDGRYYEPLLGFYSREILDVMKGLMDKGNYKPPDLLDRIRVKKLMVQQDFPHYSTQYFKSVNFPADLENMQ